MKLRRFLGGGLCWQEIWHHSATQHKLPSQQQSQSHLMTVLPTRGTIFQFVNDCSNLATSFFAVFVKSFPHSPPSMWGNYYFGTVPHLYKDMCYYCPAQIQFINRCGRKFFFSLQKDVTFGVCGLMWENKSRWQGAFSLLEDFLAQQRKEEREALIQLDVQKQLYSWINCKCSLFGKYRDLKLIVMYKSQFELTLGFKSPS